jgi:intraflagellar transport protein 80
LEHTLEIAEIGLNKNEVASERKIGFIDINKDFHLSPVHKRDVVREKLRYN